MGRTVRAVVLDDYRCLRCGHLFRWKRPEHVRWVADPGPDPVTGKHDPERGSNEGDPPPTCPHCQGKYVRRIIGLEGGWSSKRPRKPGRMINVKR